MRARPGMFAVLLLLGMLLPGCGPAEQKPNLLKEYATSTRVRNDPFPSPDGTSGEDRLANFASIGPAAAVAGGLLGVQACADPDCELPMSVRRAAGTNTQVQLRHALVKHEDGSLEVIDLYVAGAAGKPGVLYDAEANSYRDLAEFQASNDRLGSDDWLLIARNVASTTDDGNRPTTVRGQTGAGAPLWLFVAVGLLLVLLVVVVLAHVRRSRRQGSALEQQWQRG